MPENTQGDQKRKASHQFCSVCQGYIAGKKPEHLLAHMFFYHRNKPLPDSLKELEKEFSAEGEEAKDRRIVSIAYPVDLSGRYGIKDECQCECHKIDDINICTHVGSCCTECPGCKKRIPGINQSSLFSHIVERHPAILIPRNLQFLVEVFDQLDEEDEKPTDSTPISDIASQMQYGKDSGGFDDADIEVTIVEEETPGKQNPPFPYDVRESGGPTIFSHKELKAMTFEPKPKTPPPIGHQEIDYEI